MEWKKENEGREAPMSHPFEKYADYEPANYIVVEDVSILLKMSLITIEFRAPQFSKTNTS